MSDTADLKEPEVGDENETADKDNGEGEAQTETEDPAK